MEVPQKIKNRSTMLSSDSSSEYVSKENENRISKQYMHYHVYYSIINNNQDTETT